MIPPSIQAEILRLAFTDRRSQRAIAEELGVDRKTVAAILRRRSVQLDRSEMSPRSSILDPHLARIEALLREAPRRSAVNLLQALRNGGYTGGITILKDYLHSLRPASTPEAFLSLEFVPGQAAQVDWGEFGDPFGIGRKLHCFVMVMCWSRMHYLEFTLSATFESFVRCHERAFAFFRGVPREIWYDNLASAVAERQGRLVRFQPRFFAYAGHHRFRPIACNRAAGHEKGRVEDGVRFIRYNFWPGRTLSDLDDLNAQAFAWRDGFANRRTHATTRKIPELVFPEEQKLLLPAQQGFDADEVRSPRASHQFRVDFDSNAYSVPWRLAGRILTLRADDRTVQLFLSSKRVAVHPRSWLRGQEITSPAHEEGLRDLKPGAQHSADLQAIRSLGENAARYLELLPAQTLSIRSEISRLMVLITVHGAAMVEAIIGKALAQGIVGSLALERLLTLETKDQPKRPAPLALADPRLRIVDAVPDLRSYDAILLQEESHADTD